MSNLVPNYRRAEYVENPNESIGIGVPMSKRRRRNTNGNGIGQRQQRRATNLQGQLGLGLTEEQFREMQEVANRSRERRQQQILSAQDITRLRNGVNTATRTRNRNGRAPQMVVQRILNYMIAHPSFAQIFLALSGNRNARQQFFDDVYSAVFGM